MRSIFGAVVGLGLFSAQGAEVGTIAIDGKPVITIKGEMRYGDERKFVDAALARSDALVIFDSPGGNLNAGIEIGKAIRLKGFRTGVLPGSVCASACALAWMGGQKRFIVGNARVGFHAAYFAGPTGEPITTSSGNALVGAYLNQLGLPTSAILYVTEAPPQSMRWLSADDAQGRGIEVTSIVADLPDVTTTSARPQPLPSNVTTLTVRPTPLPSVTAPPSVDWTSQGEWVQTASRSELADAVMVAQIIVVKNPNTAVFRYQNGWFGVVVGPFSPGRGEMARAALVGAAEVPADSLVTRGDRFASLAWGSPKPRVAPDGPATVSTTDRAIAFANQFQSAWSSDNATALAFLERSYGDTILYYGKPTSRDAVMKEKARFAQRWSSRRYVARPGSLSATCMPDQSECTVTGVVEWTALAPSRGLQSNGSATFEMRLGYKAGLPVIVSETSSVIDRRREVLPAPVQ